MVTQIIEKQINRLEFSENNFFWTVFGLFVLLIISYGFLLNRTIINTVAQEKMEKEIVYLSSEINSLEFQYLNIKNNITLSLAESKGFVSVAHDKFAIIDQDRKNISLSINEN